MNSTTRRIMIIAGGILSSFALSAYCVVAALHPSGYIHDSAFVLIVGALPVGGWSGAYLTWIIGRLTSRNDSDKVLGSFVGSAGCLGALAAWVLVIIFMRLIGVKGD